MHYVVLGTHSPETCPLSNAKTKALLLDIGPQIPNIAKQHGVNIVAGPFVNREHMTVAIVETESADDLDSFFLEQCLVQHHFIDRFSKLRLYNFQIPCAEIIPHQFI